MEVAASDKANSTTQRNGQGGDETEEEDQNTEPSNQDAILQQEASDKDLPGLQKTLE